jgi:hypothetical protein
MSGGTSLIVPGKHEGVSLVHLGLVVGYHFVYCQRITSCTKVIVKVYPGEITMSV